MQRKEFLSNHDEYCVEHNNKHCSVRCSKCDIIFTVSTYYYYKKRKAGHLPICKECRHSSGRKDQILNDPQIIEQPKTYSDNSKLLARCDKCHNNIRIGIDTYWKIKKRDGVWACYDCKKPDLIKKSVENPIYQTEEYKQKISNIKKGIKPAENTKKKISESVKESWKDKETREKHLAHRRTKEFRARVSEWAKEQWESDEYRNNQIRLRTSPEYKKKASKISKRLWQNPEYRRKVEKSLHKIRPLSAPRTTVSSLQTILYSILDDMDIKYYKEGPETTIGPIVTSEDRFEVYTFDCLVEHNNKKLFIECHGEYWHSNRSSRDMAKATFLNKYFSQYDLLVIWEYEYRSYTRIKNIIKEKLGIKEQKKINFCKSDIVISKEEVSDDLKSFIATNHYLANIGRYGSYRIIGRHGYKIMGAAIFSHPTRKESYKRLGLKKSEVYELTRFCIHPSYQEKNISSWFLSKTIRLIKKENNSIKALLSFADSGFGHLGTVYKATNWLLDGEVKPDYWYSDGKNWYHKKSIWDLAAKHNMREQDYAESCSLHRVHGKKKYRYLYWL